MPVVSLPYSSASDPHRGRFPPAYFQPAAPSGDHRHRRSSSLDEYFAPPEEHYYRPPPRNYQRHRSQEPYPPYQDGEQLYTAPVYGNGPYQYDRRPPPRPIYFYPYHEDVAGPPPYYDYRYPPAYYEDAAGYPYDRYSPSRPVPVFSQPPAYARRQDADDEPPQSYVYYDDPLPSGSRYGDPLTREPSGIRFGDRRPVPLRLLPVSDNVVSAPWKSDGSDRSTKNPFGRDFPVFWKDGRPYAMVPLSAADGKQVPVIQELADEKTGENASPIKNAGEGDPQFPLFWNSRGSPFLLTPPPPADSQDAIKTKEVPAPAAAKEVTSSSKIEKEAATAKDQQQSESKAGPLANKRFFPILWKDGVPFMVIPPSASEEKKADDQNSKQIEKSTPACASKSHTPSVPPVATKVIPVIQTDDSGGAVHVKPVKDDIKVNRDAEEKKEVKKSSESTSPKQKFAPIALKVDKPKRKSESPPKAESRPVKREEPTRREDVALKQVDVQETSALKAKEPLKKTEMPGKAEESMKMAGLQKSGKTAESLREPGMPSSRSIKVEALDKGGNEVECQKTSAPLDAPPARKEVEKSSSPPKSESGERGAANNVRTRKSFSDASAATLIQSVYRGHLVRKCEPLKHLRVIKNVETKASELVAQAASTKRDSKERKMIAEGIMTLLLQLDAIQGVHPSVRSIRKEAAKKLIRMQEDVEDACEDAPPAASDELGNAHVVPVNDQILGPVATSNASEAAVADEAVHLAQTSKTAEDLRRQHIQTGQEALADMKDDTSQEIKRDELSDETTSGRRGIDLASTMAGTSQGSEELTSLNCDKVEDNFTHDLSDHTRDNVRALPSGLTEGLDNQNEVEVAGPETTDSVLQSSEIKIMDSKTLNQLTNGSRTVESGSQEAAEKPEVSSQETEEVSLVREEDKVPELIMMPSSNADVKEMGRETEEVNLLTEEEKAVGRETEEATSETARAKGMEVEEPSLNEAAKEVHQLTEENKTLDLDDTNQPAKLGVTVQAEEHIPRCEGDIPKEDAVDKVGNSESSPEELQESLQDNALAGSKEHEVLCGLPPGEPLEHIQPGHEIVEKSLDLGVEEALKYPGEVEKIQEQVCEQSPKASEMPTLYDNEELLKSFKPVEMGARGDSEKVQESFENGADGESDAASCKGECKREDSVATTVGNELVREGKIHVEMEEAAPGSTRIMELEDAAGNTTVLELGQPNVAIQENLDSQHYSGESAAEAWGLENVAAEANVVPDSDFSCISNSLDLRANLEGVAPKAEEYPQTVGSGNKSESAENEAAAEEHAHATADLILDKQMPEVNSVEEGNATITKDAAHDNSLEIAACLCPESTIPDEQSNAHEELQPDDVDTTHVSMDNVAVSKEAGQGEAAEMEVTEIDVENASLLRQLYEENKGLKAIVEKLAECNHKQAASIVQLSDRIDRLEQIYSKKIKVAKPGKIKPCYYGKGSKRSK